MCVESMNQVMLANVCKVIECEPCDITDVQAIKTGLTNSSYQFSCKGKSYVYRHPGIGTDTYINRYSEAESMTIAKELNLDDTFIYIDSKEGWKLSYFIDDAKTLDYHNEQQVEKALGMLRTLHGSGKKTSQEFDIYQEIGKFLKRQKPDADFSQFPDMWELIERIRRLHEYVEADGYEKCLCHCDSYDPNFLLDVNGKMYLIDWEYSGMSDPGCDIGTFIACSDYTMEECDLVIEKYLGYKPKAEEIRHWIAYVAIAADYWFVWALYQESLGKSTGDYLQIWHDYTRQYSERALKMYEE